VKFNWTARHRLAVFGHRQRARITSMVVSEKRQITILARPIFVGSIVGAIAMSVQIFSLERIKTPTGRMVIVTTDEHWLRAVDWEDHEPRMQRLLRRHYGTNAILCEMSCPSAARRSLQAYFEGDLDAVTCLPTATNGTDFQRTVWDALRRIPVGHTISYGALAFQIGRPTAMRAVGLANGANPIAIVIPCHRVIGANASLTGYGGGLDRKRWLLQHESACSAARGESHFLT
jgi:methylated-DNA-[protein]-cysteine S-methyltransferase